MMQHRQAVAACYLPTDMGPLLPRGQACQLVRYSSVLCKTYLVFGCAVMASQGGTNWQGPTAAQQLAPCHRQVYLSQQPPQLATESLPMQVPRQSTQQRLEACNKQARWI